MINKKLKAMKTRNNTMKRLALLLAAMVMPLVATAQTIEFKAEAYGKMLAKANEPRFIGCKDGSVVMVDYKSRKAVLARYDMAQNEQASVELGSAKEIESYGGFVNGDNVDLLNVHRTSTSMRIYRDRRDVLTLQPRGEQLTLAEYKGSSDDQYVFSLGVSPNQQLLAGVSVMAKKGFDAEVRVALYNRELEEYWHMDVQCPGFNQVLVSDSGEVVLAYCTTDDKKYCTFTIVDGESTNQVSFKLLNDDGITMEAALIRYGNGKLLVGTTVREENHVVMPIGTNIDRVDFFSCDVSNNVVTHTKHAITDLECNRMANDKDTKTPKHHWVQFGNLLQGIADDQGAYFMMDQTWTVSQNNIPVEYHHRGMLVIRVDADGHVQWTRPLRLEAESSYRGRNCIAYRWRTTPDGIMLAAAQNVKNIDLPDEKPIKALNVTKNKAVLSVITLDRTGRLNRQNFDIGKQTVFGAAHTIDLGSYMLFLVGGNGKGQFARLNVK